jgi:hypothetical protein
MTWLKLAALVLGSVWFFPVSCTSTLMAGRGGVTPLSSRMFHVRHMFSALPYAFGIALTTCVIGRYLHRRVHAASAGGAA